MPNDWKRLHDIADKYSPVIVDILEGIFESARDVPGNVIAALEQGNIATAARLIEEMWGQVLEAARPDLAMQLRNAFETAAMSTAIPGMDLRFDLVNPRSMHWIQRNTGAMIREIDQTTREAIRQLIYTGWRDGLTNQQMAMRIRSMIGLTSRQVSALDRLRQTLESGEFSDLPKEVLDRLRRLRVLGRARQGKIDQVIEAYRKRMIRERAETIARTESAKAASAGQAEMWRQGADSGEIDRNQMEVRWILTPDDKLCERCRAQQDLRRPIDGDYPNGASHPPLHPRCRCAEGLVEKRENAP